MRIRFNTQVKNAEEFLAGLEEVAERLENYAGKGQAREEIAEAAHSLREAVSLLRTEPASSSAPTPPSGGHLRFDQDIRHGPYVAKQLLLAADSLMSYAAHNPQRSDLHLAGDQLAEAASVLGGAEPTAIGPATSGSD